MIKKILIIILFSLAFNFNVSGQNFISAYSGSKAICGVTGFKEDSLNNKLFMYGNVLNTPCGLNYNYIACNQNSNWSFLGTFNHSISSVEIFNNELYACGWFTSINGQSIPSIAKYNGISWVSVVNFSNAINLWKLKVINGELYVCGGIINTVNGNFNGVAKFDGTSWSGFNIPYLGDNGFYVKDVTFFNNEMYIGGNFYISSGEQDLLYYHNGIWQKLGVGLSGSMGEVAKLQVYKNRLYIGGLIFKGDGNVGNMLIAWDNNNLISVGDGLKDNINTYGTAQVKDMMVFQNKLYIVGNFNYASNIFSCGLTTFDGNTFCSFNKTQQISVGLDAIGHYKDTLWISGPQKYLNDSIKAIGKYIGSNSSDTCSLFYDVRINDNLIKDNNNLIIFPNPATNIISVLVNSFDFLNSNIQIINYSGQIILNMDYREKIDISNLSNGIYCFKITLKIINT